VIVARRFRVAGRVQGVGFRAFVLDTAAAEGLGGWVANLPDGNVEGVVEGEREAVERFRGKLTRGPARARVERVDFDEDVPGGLGRRFDIK
jgi:acylphosphatase